MKDLQTIAQALNGRPQVDGSYMCHCPVHEDRNPSLSLAQREDGSILFHCHAGCPQEEVLAAFVSTGLWAGDDTTSVSEQEKTRLLKEAERHREERGKEAEQAASLAQNVWQKAETVPMDNEVVGQLVKLSKLDYDRKRKEVAKQLRVRVEILDKQVAVQRKGEDDSLLTFKEVTPWEGDLDPSQLLSDITDAVKRFVVCSDETAQAVALWIVMTWFIDVIQVAPLAIITAPEKRCGKTVLLSLIGKLAFRPLSASNISSAAVYRTIEICCPTLILDEADAWMKQNEDLRGIINSGHTRDCAFVIRLVGDNHEPKRFSTWGAKALAGISAKNLAATLTDRAILLEMRRKLPGETVERLRHAGQDLFQTLTAKLARFAEDFRETIKNSRPSLPPELNDRAQDNWEPLLAIADAAGGAWPELARETAITISGEEEATRSVSIELLSDIQEIFNKRRADKIRTADLIADLCSDEELPWATYNRGFPIKPRQIASRLKEFSVKSVTLRVGATTAKGYRLDQFGDSFDRYLSSPETPGLSVTTSHNGNHSIKSVTPSVTVTDPSVTADYVPHPDIERVSKQV